jgi:RimJ/RimL family protein N-acetyltransferase
VNLAIRIATAEDFDRLIVCDEYSQTSERRRQEITTWLNERACYIGEIEGSIFGFVVLEHRFFGYDFVPLVCVARDMRNKSLGLALLEAVEQYYCSPKLFTSTNASNAAAIRLFEKAGFSPSGVIKNLDDGDAELVFFKRVRA